MRFRHRPLIQSQQYREADGYTVQHLEIAIQPEGAKARSFKPIVIKVDENHEL